nr:RNA-directed DNA polymerase, eukaryota [Tanacetum cinerariifolium]
TVFRGKVIWIRAKEVPGWVPELLVESDDEDISEDGIMEGDHKTQDEGSSDDMTEVPDTVFNESNGPNQKMSNDPFNLYPLLNRKSKENQEKVNEEDLSLKFPPGFTPILEKGVEGEHISEDGFVGQINDSVNRDSKGDVSESVCSGRFKQSEVPRTGGSFLGLMEEVVKVGQTMGYNMEGGILCVWDPCSFQKTNHTISDYFVILLGVWLKNGVDLLIVVVYGPHDPRDKRGAIRGAITLERYLSDHRPIFLREVSVDYGPVLFRFFHHWLELDGFSDFVMDSWKKAPGDLSNGVRNLLRSIDENIKAGNGTNTMVTKRMEVISELQRIDKMNAQKAKIKWSIEGDENSRFFHGILNKKRNQSNIRGVMVDGIWQEKPNVVKSEFFKHFCTRFDKPSDQRAVVEMLFPRQILDGHFILNEVLQWCKSRKKQALIFKVDFEKLRL